MASLMIVQLVLLPLVHIAVSAPAQTSASAVIAESEAKVARLRASLKSPAVTTRHKAALELASQNNLATIAALEDLVNALKDPDPEVRSSVALAIGTIGRWAETVSHSNSSLPLPVEADRASRHWHVIAPAVASALGGALRDQNENVREWAATALGSIPVHSRGEVEALRLALTDRSARVRSAAAGALSEIRPVAASSIAELTKLLSDHDRNVRLAAARALARSGTAGRTAVPDLVRILRTDDADIRQSAAEALGVIRDAGAVPALVESLTHVYFPIREAAATALGNIGSQAREALGALSSAEQKDPELRVRRAAADARKKIQSK